MASGQTALNPEENPFVPKIPVQAQHHEPSTIRHFLIEHRCLIEKLAKWLLAIFLSVALSYAISFTQSCNKYFLKNCRPCDEFSYWRNLKEKRNEFEISDHDWKRKNLATFYDVNDGECKNHECSCNFGSKGVNICTENQQQYCTNCDDGYYLVAHSDGLSWKEFSTTDKSKNRKICKKNVCVCNNGTPSCKKGMNHGEISCLKCDPGFILTKPDQFNRTYCTCDDGYHLGSNICKKNVCVCKNGTPSPSCKKGMNHGESSCLKCDPGSSLTKPDKLNRTYCNCDHGYYSAGGGICKKNVCVCKHGTPSCKKGMNHGESSCLKCDQASFYRNIQANRGYPDRVLTKPDNFNRTYCNCPTGTKLSLNK